MGELTISVFVFLVDQGLTTFEKVLHHGMAHRGDLLCDLFPLLICE